MLWTACRIVAFDTETTGLNPFDGDRVIEFGAVELEVGADGRVLRVKPHQMFINPEIPIPRAASKVSGITDDDVSGAPLFGDVSERVRSILQDAVVVAHNLSFDIGFIRTELKRVGKFWPRTRAEVDTLPLSQRLLPELKSHKLEAICTALGVPLDNAHRASHDAEACGRAFIELARRKAAPGDLEGLCEWADAVGPPPDTGHIVLGDRGGAELRFGAHAGDLVEKHPEVLQWMTMALERKEGRWVPRFPDSVQQWARRWLRVRGAGRAIPPQRSQGAQDWTLDPPAWR
jgi:DNA polymerase III epsilon subunit